MSKTQSEFRSTVIGRRAAPQAIPASVSRDDPFATYYDSHSLQTPRFDPAALQDFYEDSEDLGPVLDAYAIMTEGLGWQLERYKRPGSEEPPPIQDADLEEQRERAVDFLESLSPEDPERMRIETRLDLLVTGDRYFEVVRNPEDKTTLPGSERPADGYVSYLKRMDPAYVRCTVVDPTPVRTVWWRRGRDGRWRKGYQFKRFRRYAEQVAGTITWFREFGDPRQLDRFTGEFFEGPFDPARSATEVIHDRWARDNQSPYGLSPLVGVLLAIDENWYAASGNREDLVHGFQVPLALLLSGTHMDRTGRERLEEDMDKMQGPNGRGRIMILEGIPPEAASLADRAGIPAVRMDLKPLRQPPTEDALFLKLQARNADKIRQRYRVPPILVGATSDFNYATAFASIWMAENTVFWPERRRSDSIFNGIFPEFGIWAWQMKTQGLPTADYAQIATLLGIGTDGGAITPNEIRETLSDLLDAKLPPIDEDWANKPIKQQAGGQTPGAPPKGDAGTGLSQGGAMRMLSELTRAARERRREKPAEAS